MNDLRKIHGDRFPSLMQSHNIVCFGAGRALQNFCVIMNDTEFLHHIDYVVDNAESKWGEYVSLANDVKVPIQSHEYMKTHIKDNTIILITCNQQESIRFQLSQYHELKDVEIFDFAPIKNKYIVQRARNVKLPASLRRTQTPVLPQLKGQRHDTKGDSLLLVRSQPLTGTI